MFLSRVYLNPLSKEARRDLGNPYEMHATLCRAFSESTERCPPGEVLWRLESDSEITDQPRILVQSVREPNWEGIGVSAWFSRQPAAPLDLVSKLRLENLSEGMRFRFRLRANPSVTRNNKRLGLLKPEDQRDWIVRKGAQGGFEILSVTTSHEEFISCRQHKENTIRIYSVLFDGELVVRRPELFRATLASGIGHGKALGLGLLSVAMIP